MSRFERPKKRKEPMKTSIIDYPEIPPLFLDAEPHRVNGFNGNFQSYMSLAKVVGLKPEHGAKSVLFRQFAGAAGAKGVLPSVRDKCLALQREVQSEFCFLGNEFKLDIDMRKSI